MSLPTLHFYFYKICDPFIFFIYLTIFNVDIIVGIPTGWNNFFSETLWIKMVFWYNGPKRKFYIKSKKDNVRLWIHILSISTGGKILQWYSEMKINTEIHRPHILNASICSQVLKSSYKWLLIFHNTILKKHYCL